MTMINSAVSWLCLASVFGPRAATSSRNVDYVATNYTGAAGVRRIILYEVVLLVVARGRAYILQVDSLPALSWEQIRRIPVGDTRC